MKRCLAVLLLVVHCLLSFAQSGEENIRIKGVVYQKLSGRAKNVNVGLGGCLVQLFYERDGKLDSLYTVSSTPDGYFSFRNVPQQRVVLKFRCLGYEVKSGVYDLEPGENAILVTMKEQKEELKESVIVDEIPLMKRLRDTTIFNTKAIKSLPGDDLRSVLEQLPGFSVSDNGIYVEGMKVSKTYVNGLLIFGDEAMNAVNSLKADEVTQVKVYDEQTALDKHRGRKNSKKERVLNVITKENFLALTQYGIAAAAGADLSPQFRYQGIAAMAYDSQMTNFNVYCYGSNLPKEDRFAIIPGSFSYFNSLNSCKSLQDYVESERAGVSYTKHWNNRLFGNTLQLRYYFNHKYTRDASRTITEYFETENSPLMRQIDSVFSGNSEMKHYMTASLNLLDTPWKSFYIGASGSFSGRNRFTENLSMQDNVAVQTLSRHENSSFRGRDWDVEGEVRWTNNDPVKWRPEIEMSVDAGRNSSLSWTVDTLKTSFLKRQLSSDAYGNKIKTQLLLSLESNLINDKRHTLDLKLSAKAEYNRDRSRQMSVDEWDVLTPVMDMANSYDYTRNEVIVSGIGAITYSTSKQLNITGNISLHGKGMLNDETIPATFSKRKNFIYPEYEFDMRLPHGQVESHLYGNTPSIEQISNRISDSTPLVLTGGNPDLGQSYNWVVSGQYNKETETTKKGITQFLSINASTTCQFRPIVSNVIYFDKDTVLDRWDGYTARAGARLNTFSNASRPSWNIGFNGRYDVSFKYDIVKLRFNFSSRYAQTSQFNGNTEIWIGDWNSSLNMLCIYKPSTKLHIVAGPTISYLQSDDNAGRNLSSRFVYSGRLSLDWSIVRRLKLSGNYRLSGYDYISGMGKNHFTNTLNLELKALLLKDYSLQVSVQALDLLNSGSVYTPTVTASYMTEKWCPTYGRYFLLNIKYVFRLKKK